MFRSRPTVPGRNPRGGPRADDYSFPDLDKYGRMNTAIQIADRIKAKTGMQPQPLQHVDDFLEEAAKKIRDSSHYR
jgi:hypothetical protein